MTEKTKRILLAVGFVVVTLLMAFLLYWIIFRPTLGPVVVENVNELPPGVLPETNVNGGPTVVNINGQEVIIPQAELPVISTVALGDKTLSTELTDSAVTNMDLSADGSTMRYYDPASGTFSRVNADGTITAISATVFKDVDSVAWSPVKDEAILEFPDGSNIYYNFQTGKQVTLPKEYEEFSYSGTGSSIAFKYMHIDEERRVLAVANPDGSGARTLEALGDNANKVDVNFSPDGTVAATFREFIDAHRQEVGFIGLNNENFKGMVVEGSGFEGAWDPDGTQMVYSVYSTDSRLKPTLWVVDAKGNDIGKNRIDLGVNTWADKCAFSSNGGSVYCGVPKDLPNGAGIVPDLAQRTTDDIYQINLSTGQKTKVAIPVDINGVESTSVEKMSISEDGSTLYYVDAITGRLNKINLK
ncbi:MAG: hypothetical protein AAB558_02345 [Patescibacteria group bacterium]